MQSGKQIFYRQTTLFALLIGGCFTVASYLCYINTGQVFNHPVLDRTINFLFIIGLFISIRQYRDSVAQQGFITYGKALLTGMWISLLTGLVYCLYTILLYSLHPELVTNYLHIVQELLRQTYGDSPLGEMADRFFTVFVTPFSIGVTELFGKFVNGLIFTLIIAAFLRKQPINHVTTSK